MIDANLSEDFLKNLKVRQIVCQAFYCSAIKHSDEHKRWVNLSHDLGSRIAEGAVLSIQCLGDLDIIVRAMEDELVEQGFAEPDVMEFPALTLQSHLSDVWVGGAYEIFRLAKSRLQEDAEAVQLHDALRLLRIPLEKYELPKDDKLKDVVRMAPLGGGEDDVRIYDKNDKSKSHLIPRSLSNLGSAMWLAIDIANQSQHWLERRDLSDAILRYGEKLRNR